MQVIKSTHAIEMAARKAFRAVRARPHIVAPVLRSEDKGINLRLQGGGAIFSILLTDTARRSFTRFCESIGAAAEPCEYNGPRDSPSAYAVICATGKVYASVSSHWAVIDRNYAVSCRIPNGPAGGSGAIGANAKRTMRDAKRPKVEKRADAVNSARAKLPKNTRDALTIAEDVTAYNGLGESARADIDRKTAARQRLAAYVAECKRAPHDREVWLEDNRRASLALVEYAAG
jgi:hypothetical protein